MNTPITQLEQLTLTKSSRKFLKETAKWGFFLSIMGFILVGLMLLFSIFATTIFGMVQKTQPQAFPVDLGITMTITYFIVAVIYFFPVYYLFQFSKKMKMALVTKNDDFLAKAFEMLKSHYKFIGVLTIITLSLYVLLIIVSMLGLL